MRSTTVTARPEEQRPMSHDHPPGLDLDRLRGLLDRERPGPGAAAR